MNQKLPDECFKCGAKYPDSSGRCIDCVNRDFRVFAMKMNDKRSIWKIRDIENDDRNRLSTTNRRWISR